MTGINLFLRIKANLYFQTCGSSGSVHITSNEEKVLDYDVTFGLEE